MRLLLPGVWFGVLRLISGLRWIPTASTLIRSSMAAFSCHRRPAVRASVLKGFILTMSLTGELLLVMMMLGRVATPMLALMGRDVVPVHMLTLAPKAYVGTQLPRLTPALPLLLAMVIDPWLRSSLGHSPALGPQMWTTLASSRPGIARLRLSSSATLMQQSIISRCLRASVGRGTPSLW